MRRRLYLACLGLLLSASLTAGARADAQQDFARLNSTEIIVLQLFIGPSSSDFWGSGILGTGILAAGASTDIQFHPGSTGCEWDRKVMFLGGAQSVYRSLNLCSISRITLVSASRAIAE